MTTAARPCRQSGGTPARQWIARVALAVVAGCLILPSTTQARQNSVSGSVSVGNDYDSNVFRSDDNRVDEWISQVAPQLSFTSKGLTDSISLVYAPQFDYNYRRDDDEMAQALSLVADKGISSRWKVKLTGNFSVYDNLFFQADRNLSEIQNFLRADPATQAEIVRILFPELAWDPARDMATVISQFQARFAAASQADQGLVTELLFQGVNGARQRYSTSELAVSSEYEFAEKSTFTLGYRFNGLDNNSGKLVDHFEHTPSLLVSYQFNPEWRAVVGYDLVIADYGTSKTFATEADHTNNHPHLQVDFQLSPKNLLFWDYDYQLITFDEALRDTTEQGSHLGWRHGLDHRTTLTTAVGAGYLGRDFGYDERVYTLDLALSRSYERGTMGLFGQGLTAVASSADTWEKSRRSWELGGDLTYRLRKDLVSIGRLSYGQRDTWFLDDHSDYDTFRLGAGLNYPFKRWFTLSLDYDYYLFDTDAKVLDSYAEHLLSIRLGAGKELWRW